MKHTEVRHFHLFCGLGGGARGFNRGSARIGQSEARFRCLGGIDSDPAAIADFQRLTGAPGTVMDLFSREQYAGFHGQEPPEGWREATPADVRRAAGGERPHIIFTSAPCLPADGLVVTEDGPRAICTIRPGDQVLTHRGRLRAVTHVGKQPYSGTMYGFRLNGTVDFQWFTDEHPLWTRRIVRNASTGRKRALGEAGFMPARAVRVGDRIGFPIDRARPGTADAFVRSLGNPRALMRGGHSTGRYAKPRHEAVDTRIVDLTAYAEDPHLWFLLGCYLGDGYRRKTGNYEVAFCVGAKQGPLAERVRESLDYLGIPHSDDDNGGLTNIKVRARGRHLHMLCGAFGDGAEHKRLPPILMNIEDALAEQLIEGYRATDGSEQASRLMPGGNTLQARWKIPSVSLQLLRDFQRLLLRQGVFGSIHKAWTGGTQVIMGREVQTKPRWEINVRLDPIKRTCFSFSDDVVWVRVREIARRESDEEVWNLSVREDDTFCAPMIATHNCKGFSGLLSQSRSTTPKYQALNGLTLRGVWLALEAWADDPPEFLLFENVPRVANRGRPLLDQICALLRRYGYAVAETTHDCGELGGLAQSRRRFLLVARHQEKVPPFLYEPIKRPLLGVGDVLGALPMPGDASAGPMHRVAALQWRTWVRLALVEAGGDWRSLQRLRVQDGVLADYGIVPDQAWRRGTLGVCPWDAPSTTVTGNGRPGAGRFAVADPRRAEDRAAFGQYGVKAWSDTAQTVIGKAAVGAGPFAVADPRIGQNGPRFNNVYRVVRWAHASAAVTAGGGPSAGGLAVCDPRPGWQSNRPHYQSAGHYGVVPWARHAYAVTGKAKHDTGRWAVADPRPIPAGGLPDPTERGLYVIRSLDDTWHRPFTTLELASLQGLVDPEEYMVLHGRSEAGWRERIGNAVPPPAAQAIASVMGRALLTAWHCESFSLETQPIWVRDLAVALSVAQEGDRV